MSFRQLLIHRATFNNVTGEGEKDAYGRPKLVKNSKLNEPCRIDNVTKSRSTDEKGVDYIEKYLLFCYESSGVAEETTIENITDSSGKTIAGLDGKFIVTKIKPRFRRSRLHHIEAELKRV